MSQPTSGHGVGFVIEEVNAGGWGRYGRLGGGGVDKLGAAGVIQHLRSIEYRALDFEPVFDRIHKSFRASERSLFAGNGPSSSRWAPLTPKYAAYKARKGHDPRTMRRTGALELALTTGAGPGAVNEVGKDEATFGTDLHYAVFAQRGTGRRRRKVLVVSRRQRGVWTAMIRDHLLNADDLNGGG